MAFILTITVEPIGAGSVLLKPKGEFIPPNKVSYEDGTIVTLTPIPSISGALFDHWAGDWVGTQDPLQLSMQRDWNITAVFSVPEETPTFELTTGIIGVGSVAPSSGIFNPGDQTILVASPGVGSQFSKWSGNIGGAEPVPGMPDNLRVTMDRDRHIVAEFEKVTTPPPPSPEFAFLEIDIIGQGSVSKEPDQNGFEVGTIVLLTATPDSGHKFVEWKGDITGTNPSGFPIEMDSDKFVEAVFEPITAPPPPPPPPPEDPEFRNLTTTISKSG